MRIILFVVLIFFVSCSQTFYIVRHAEKAPAISGADKMELQNPELSATGNDRAIALMEKLRYKNVRHIFSTNYKRTILTATPLAQANHVNIVTYNPAATALADFVTQLKAIKKGNVLIVGHSNTIDDLANALTDAKVVEGDVPEAVYNNLFIIKRKGKRFIFSKEQYGN